MFAKLCLLSASHRLLPAIPWPFPFLSESLSPGKGQPLPGFLCSFLPYSTDISGGPASRELQSLFDSKRQVINYQTIERIFRLILPRKNYENSFTPNKREGVIRCSSDKRETWLGSRKLIKVQKLVIIIIILLLYQYLHFYKHSVVLFSIMQIGL